jgi:hypothetical protein
MPCCEAGFCRQGSVCRVQRSGGEIERNTEGGGSMGAANGTAEQRQVTAMMYMLEAQSDQSIQAR